jgi:hypothetical protein
VPHYSVFGRQLASPLPLPHLVAADGGAAHWHLEEVMQPLPKVQAHPLASLRVDHCRFALSRTSTGYRFAHSCSGIYDIDVRAGVVSWQRRPGAPIEQAEGDLVGRLLPLLLHEEGMLGLHGSGVLTDEGVVAFLADSGAGKSTLAQALVAEGARLVGDDAVVIDVADGLRVQPGISALRLCPDAATVLLADAAGSERSTDGKHVVRGPAFPTDDVQPLRAIYLIEPDSTGRMSVDVTSRRLPSSAAALALIRHDKLLGLLGPGEGATLLARAAAVTRVVPVYALSVARRLDRVRDVAATILAWHAATPAVQHAGR